MSELFVQPAQLLRMDGSPIAASVPAFDEEKRFIDNIFTRLGEIDSEFLFNDVLVAKYEREKVSPNLIASAETQKSDYYEGVVGLVLIVGPTAFQDDRNTTFPWEAWIRSGLVKERGQPPIKPGDWVLYRCTDGWDKDVQLRGELTWAHCRVLQDAHIRGKVKYPGRWW